MYSCRIYTHTLHRQRNACFVLFPWEKQLVSIGETLCFQHGNNSKLPSEQPVAAIGTGVKCLFLPETVGIATQLRIIVTAVTRDFFADEMGNFW